MWRLQTTKIARSVKSATRGLFHTCRKHSLSQNGKIVFSVPAATLPKRGLVASGNNFAYDLSCNAIGAHQSRCNSTLDESEESKEAVNASGKIPDFWADRDSRAQAVRISDDLFEVAEQHAINVQDILNAYENECRNRTKYHAGYPYNLDYDFSSLSPFLQYSINNLGDPYVKRRGY